MWTQFHIITNAALANTLSEELTALGACAVTFEDAGDQPIFEPSLTATPLWENTRLTALFDETTSLTDALNYLSNCQASGTIKTFERESFADEDWVKKGLADFKPTSFGKRLWICPSWEKPPVPEAINVILDPGLAFGTGTHPTTALCLQWLDQHISTEPLIIDYGCGSGILAIAALKLGAQTALAIDHDPQALIATKQNADFNGLSDQQIKTYLSADAPHIQADVLIANILAGPLISLAPLFAQLVKSKGKIILSGILNDQAEAVLEAYKPWFTMQKPALLDGWVRLEGVVK